MGLHITQKEYDDIQALLQEQAKDPTTIEVEARFNPIVPIKYYDFSRLVKYLDNVYTRSSHTETLDIKGNTDTRITIFDLEGVQYYCKHDQLPSTNCIAIEKKRKKKYDLGKHAIRFSLSTETQMDVQRERDRVHLDKKTFRLKNRVSYKIGSNIRIDCTIVKSAENRENIKAVRNWGQPKYEVEIESISGTTTAAEFLGVISEVLKVLENVEYLIPDSTARNVLSNYLELITPKLDKFKRDRITKGKVHDTPRAFFMVTQPVSFEKKHLLKGTGDIYVKPYSVTHKADGERGLVYVDGMGKVYLINNCLKIKDTRITSFECKNCILDAEIVLNKNQKPGTAKITIWLFDVYVWKGEFVTKQDLASRLEYANKFVQNASATVYEVKVKEFEYTDANMAQGETYIQGFYRCCKKLLLEQKEGQLPFTTDGLILTPTGEVEGHLFNTWRECFKWKPPHDNTIDFLCRFQRDPLSNEYEIVTLENGLYHVLELSVGRECKPSTPWQYFTERKTAKNGYVPDIFNPKVSEDVVANKCYLPYSEESPEHFTIQNRELIVDNSIIELTWNKTQKRWYPLRIRQDKTELWLSTGNVAGTANDSDVAARIWLTLQNPVEETHLMGNEEIIEVPPEDTDTYYANTKTRNESETLNMNNFHNIWIKERLLKSAAANTTGKSLLDLGCGKGGDLFKWYSAGFETVIGFDQSRDNITNPKNGVYARMLQDAQTYGKKQYLFLPFDVRRPLTEITPETYPNDQEFSIAKHIWGIEELAALSSQKIEFGVAGQKFDVVSCQFAIHYFFQDDDILDTFCQNVANNLKSGGLFFATCFDGEEVNKLFKDGSRRAEGKSKFNVNKNLWAIEKHYEVYEPKTGMEIRVFVETINQYIAEYLVDMSLLINKMEQYGLKLDRTQLFGDVRNELLNTKLSTRHIERSKTKPQSEAAADAAKKMSDSEKAFSNLNRYYIFKR